jgi:hypothetical protein
MILRISRKGYKQCSLQMLLMFVHVKAFVLDIFSCLSIISQLTASGQYIKQLIVSLLVLFETKIDLN